MPLNASSSVQKNKKKPLYSTTNDTANGVRKHERNVQFFVGKFGFNDFVIFSTRFVRKNAFFVQATIKVKHEGFITNKLSRSYFRKSSNISVTHRKCNSYEKIFSSIFSFFLPANKKLNAGCLCVKQTKTDDNRQPTGVSKHNY